MCCLAYFYFFFTRDHKNDGRYSIWIIGNGSNGYICHGIKYYLECTVLEAHFGLKKSFLVICYHWPGKTQIRLMPNVTAVIYAQCPVFFNACMLPKSNSVYTPPVF